MPVGLTLDSGSVKAIVEGLSSHHLDAGGDLAGDMSCHLGGVVGSQIIGVAGVVASVGVVVGGDEVPIIFKTCSSQ